MGSKFSTLAIHRDTGLEVKALRLEMERAEGRAVSLTEVVARLLAVFRAQSGAARRG